MSRYIPEEVRKLVAERAQHRCEYCRFYARYSYLSFHIEHIISLKHGGSSEMDNLAYSCPVCNYNKGSDIATFVNDHENPIRFFHPRKDHWEDHFEVEESGLIVPKTLIGKGSIKIFDFNHPDSLIERKELIRNNIF